ncbi:MAG: magnesium transporter [Planctomycetota bacterium]|nr:magnesium transporter [Planctomycetota bacterium]
MPQEPAALTALERLVRQGSDADLRRFLLLLQPPEIADLIEALRTPSDRSRAFQAIVGIDEKADVIGSMEEEEAADVLEDLAPSEAADVLEEMQTDDAADVLQAMEEDRKEEVLREIEPEEREEISTLLEYPEESAGGIMQTELVRVRIRHRARAAVEEIRRTRDEVGELHEVFVVDDQGRLKGWVKERALILAEDSTPIEAITIPVQIKVPVTMDQEEVADLVRDYDLSSVPVVDDHDHLLGRILVDDIVDVVVEEATEDIARAAGTDPEEIYEPSVAVALKSRSPWLLATFLGGLVAAIVINAGDELVKDAGKLFIFIPVIMGMGGGCATQTATVTVRSLALGRIGLGSVWPVVRKEALVGLVLGAATGLLVWVTAAVLNHESLSVAWIAAFAIFGTICLGTLFGVVTPLVLDRTGVDPAVATHPLVTTANDIIGSLLILAFCFLVLM